MPLSEDVPADAVTEMESGENPDEATSASVPSEGEPEDDGEWERQEMLHEPDDVAPEEGIAADVEERQGAPGLPVGLAASPDADGGVAVQWDAVEGADGYRIYRSATALGTYSLVGESTETTYYDDTALPGTHYYTVVAYAGDVNGEQADPVRVAVEGEIPSLAVPENLQGSLESDESRVRLFWDAVAGAEGYRIYRSDSADGAYQRLGETPDAIYFDEEPLADLVFYTVVAYQGDVESERASPISVRVRSESPELGIPGDLSATVTDAGDVQLQWAPVEGATGYRIYRSGGGDAANQTLMETGATTYTDANPEAGTYAYRVAAFHEEAEGEPTGPVEATVGAPTQDEGDELPAPGSLTAENVGLDSVRIRWSPVTTATGYYVYRSVTRQGAFSLIGETQEDHFLDGTLFEGTYYYTVVAYRGDVTGGQASPVRVTVPPELAVKNLRATPVGHDGIRLRWEAGMPAEGYRLLRSTAQDGDYQTVGELPASVTELFDTGLASGSTYYYRVIALRGGEAFGAPAMASATTALDPDAQAPTAPERFALTALNTNTVRVTVWDAPGSNNDGYQYFYALEEDGPFEQVEAQITDTGAIIGGLAPGVTYYIFLRPYVGDRTGEPTATQSVTTLPMSGSLEAPTEVSARGLTSSSTLISWRAVPGAERYVVYRAYSKDGAYSFAGETTGLEFADTGLRANTIHYYAVEAHGGAAVSDLSAQVSAVTQKFYAPTGFVAKPYQADSVQLTWKASEGAEGYRLYRAGTRSGPFELIGSTEELWFVADGLAANVRYYFKVEAYNKGASALSDAIYGEAAKFVAPSGLAAMPETFNSIQLTWKAAPVAQGYRIYRATSRTGNYQIAGTTVDTGFLDTGLTANQIYYYKVEAFSEQHAATAGPISAMPTVFSAPTYLTVTPHDFHSIRLQWRMAGSADGFRVYRSPTKDGEFRQIAELSDTEYLDEGLENGKRYFYTVESFNRAFRLTATAGPVSATTKRMVAPVVTLRSSSHSTTAVQWTAVPEAEGYRVLRSSSYNGDYRIVSMTKSTRFVDRGLESGGTYYYKVEAHRENHTIASLFPAAVTMPGLSAPADVRAEADEEAVGVRISWDPVEDVEHYRVYRQDSRSEEFYLLGTVSDTAFHDRDSRAYAYRVEAYAGAHSASAEIVVDGFQANSLIAWLRDRF